MKYISTRGGNDKKKFTDIVLEGLAQDGGLYLPEKYPKFTDEDLNSWRKLSYPQLAFAVMKKFEVDIPDTELKKIINKAYTKEKFKYTRNKKNSEKITPVIKLKNNLYLMELSNGPTLAFKDMAMQFLGQLFEYVLNK